jgi:hypothetical protein
MILRTDNSINGLSEHKKTPNFCARLRDENKGGANPLENRKEEKEANLVSALNCNTSLGILLKFKTRSN